MQRFTYTLDQTQTCRSEIIFWDPVYPGLQLHTLQKSTIQGKGGLYMVRSNNSQSSARNHLETKVWHHILHCSTYYNTFSTVILIAILISTATSIAILMSIMGRIAIPTTPLQYLQYLLQYLVYVKYLLQYIQILCKNCNIY